LKTSTCINMINPNKDNGTQYHIKLEVHQSSVKVEYIARKK